jgi:hypothetical protein
MMDQYVRAFPLKISLLITGISSIVAQILLMRELLVSFLGNGITLGVILANWMILEAMGAFVLGKSVEGTEKRLEIYGLLQIIFFLTFPFAIYLSRIFKNLLLTTPREGLGFGPAFYASFLILLPVAVSHGALFTYGSKLYSQYLQGDAPSIGKVYVLGTVGSVIGGILITFLLIQFLNSFEIAFLIGLLNMIISTSLVWEREKPLFGFRNVISYWNGLFSPYLAGIFNWLAGISITEGIIVVAFLTFLISALFMKCPSTSGYSLPYAIFTTGFSAMIFDLAIIFTFQTLYGYLYHQIGLLVAVFMVGVAFSSHMMNRRVERIRKNPLIFLGLEGGIILFSLLLPFVFLIPSHHLEKTVVYVILYGFFFVISFLAGDFDWTSVPIGLQDLPEPSQGRAIRGQESWVALWGGSFGRFLWWTIWGCSAPSHYGSKGILPHDSNDQSQQWNAIYSIHKTPLIGFMPCPMSFGLCEFS